MTILIRRLLALPLPVLIVVLWEWAVQSNIWPRSIIAPPSAVAVDLWKMTVDGSLLHHSIVSLGRLGGGFSIGLVIGLLTGAAVGVSRSFSAFLSPTMRFLAPIPPLAWIPLLIVAFGIEGSRIALIAIGAGLVVFMSTVSGITDTRDEFIEVARLFEKSNVELLRSVLMPSAAWAIASGARVALALSWILLLASEMIASSEGLGWLIWDSRNFSRADDMIVGMLGVGTLGFFTDWLLGQAQAYVSRWRPSFKGV